MQSGAPQFGLTSDLFSRLFSLSPKGAVAVAGLAFVVFVTCWGLLWTLPIQAWFRKSIDESPECPACGSKDIRHSHINSGADRFRKKLGLHPFRCRGCTRRFFSRSSHHAAHGLTSPAEIG
jgi:hypothetical protein